MAGRPSRPVAPAANGPGAGENLLLLRYFYVDRSEPFRAFNQLERYRIAFVQGFVPIHFNRTVMNKDVLVCSGRYYETVTLSIVKPFYLCGLHVGALLYCSRLHQPLLMLPVVPGAHARFPKSS